MKDVMIEVGKFILIALLGGLGIIVLTSFISAPAIIFRYAITHSTPEQTLLAIDSLRAALIMVVIAFIVRFMVKLIADY